MPGSIPLERSRRHNRTGAPLAVAYRGMVQTIAESWFTPPFLDRPLYQSNPLEIWPLRPAHV